MLRALRKSSDEGSAGGSVVCSGPRGAATVLVVSGAFAGPVPIPSFIRRHASGQPPPRASPVGVVAFGVRIGTGRLDDVALDDAAVPRVPPGGGASPGAVRRGPHPH